MSNEQGKKTNDENKKPKAAPTSSGGPSGRTGTQPHDKSKGTSKNLTSFQAGAQSGEGSNKPGGVSLRDTRQYDSFEDIDLGDPSREPSEAELAGFTPIERRDAPHSSYNTQADHKWKYPEGFGKDKDDKGNSK